MATLPPPITHGIACHVAGRAVGRLAQQLHGGHHALGVRAFNVQGTRALRANGHVERIEALLAQLVKGDVLPHVDAAADVDAHLAEHVNLGVHDVLGKLVGRDAVRHHSARLRRPLEHGRRIAHERQVVRARKPSRPCAHDGHLLRESAAGGGRHYLGNETVFGLQVLLGDEALQFVDGNGLVNGAPRTHAASQRRLHTRPHTAGNGFYALDEGAARRGSAPARPCAGILAPRCAPGKPPCRARCPSRGTLDAVVVLVVGVPRRPRPIREWAAAVAGYCTSPSAVGSF